VTSATTSLCVLGQQPPAALPVRRSQLYSRRCPRLRPLSLLVPCSHIPCTRHDSSVQEIPTARARFFFAHFYSLGSSSFTATIDCVAGSQAAIRTRPCRSPPAACPVVYIGAPRTRPWLVLVAEKQLPLFQPSCVRWETAGASTYNFTCVFSSVRKTNTAIEWVRPSTARTSFDNRQMTVAGSSAPSRSTPAPRRQQINRGPSRAFTAAASHAWHRRRVGHLDLHPAWHNATQPWTIAPSQQERTTARLVRFRRTTQHAPFFSCCPPMRRWTSLLLVSNFDSDKPLSSHAASTSPRLLSPPSVNRCQVAHISVLACSSAESARRVSCGHHPGRTGGRT